MMSISRLSGIRMEGMAAKGFSEEEIKAALAQCDEVIEFYEDLLEEL